MPNAKMAFDAPNQTSVLTHWDPHTMRFKAVDQTTRIDFSGFGEPGKDGNGGNYVGLDSVSLRKVCFIVDGILFGCSI